MFFSQMLRILLTIETGEIDTLLFGLFAIQLQTLIEDDIGCFVAILNDSNEFLVRSVT